MNGPGSSLLIVEDESAIRTLLMTLFAERYRCQAVETASAAASLIESDFFDVVLTDVGLRGQSGLDLCRSIRGACPRTLVVMISGKNDPGAAEEAKQAGAFDFLSKPFEISDVIVTIDKAMEYYAAHSRSNSAT